MVFAHFVLVSIEKSVLVVDAQTNYLFSRYVAPLIASLLMAPITYVFKSRASATRRATLSELIEKGNVSQLLALSKVKKRRRVIVLCAMCKDAHHFISRHTHIRRLTSHISLRTFFFAPLKLFFLIYSVYVATLIVNSISYLLSMILTLLLKRMKCK